MKRFEEKVVVVIGASAGIGLSIFRELAGEGATVIGAARRSDIGGQIAADLCNGGANAHFMKVDVADRKSISALFDRIGVEFGRLDGAVNNAALTQDAYEFVNTPDTVFADLFSVNVRGTWHCMQHELRMMLPAKTGSIVNVASIAGLRGVKGLAAYTASKHAVVGATKVAALDVAAEGVRINCLCPGTTRTKMMELQMKTRPGGEEATLSMIPMRRISSPDEQARAALWLLSDDASYVTGDCIVVDGGRTI